MRDDTCQAGGGSEASGTRYLELERPIALVGAVARGKHCSLSMNVNKTPKEADMAKRQTPKQQQVVAEVCIFGTSQVGFGWITRLADGRMFGDGEPKKDRSATSALWLGMGVIGAVRGVVLVNMDTLDGRPLQAKVDALARPTFGALQWEAGPVFTISTEALLAASTKEA